MFIVGGRLWRSSPAVCAAAAIWPRRCAAPSAQLHYSHSLLDLILCKQLSQTHMWCDYPHTYTFRKREYDTGVFPAAIWTFTVAYELKHWLDIWLKESGVLPPTPDASRLPDRVSTRNLSGEVTAQKYAGTVITPENDGTLHSDQGFPGVSGPRERALRWEAREGKLVVRGNTRVIKLNCD